jgi:hypothetical protein
MMIRLAILAIVIALAGCASRDKPSGQGSLASNSGAAAGSAMGQTRDGLSDAALTPLEDLNLKRRKIPPLLAAMPSPYHVQPDMTCEDLGAEIAELDVVLGLDWDAPQPDERLRTEVLGDEAANAALGAVRSGVTGWIPYRGLIRKATGAESEEKKYNRAYKIGAQRRTYLKGYGQAKGCDLPARPDFATLLGEEQEAIVYKQDAPQAETPLP